MRRALETGRFRSHHPRLRACLTDSYLDFLRQTLQQYPRLRATRLFQMIRLLGYTGSVTQLRRRLSGFVLTLSFSRALWLEFFFDQSLENFLLGHVHAFSDWGGAPRSLETDNLRSVVLERRGDAIHFHPRFLELSAHYHFATRPSNPRAG